MIIRAARSVVKSWIVWLATGSLTLFCALFVGLLASAWWNPASRTDSVAVLVVDQDAGYVVSAGPRAGEEMRLGAEVAKSLQGVKIDGRPMFDWRAADTRRAALDALNEGDAVMAIVIPRDFSARVAALNAASSSAVAAGDNGAGAGGSGIGTGANTAGGDAAGGSGAGTGGSAAGESAAGTAGSTAAGTAAKAAAIEVIVDQSNAAFETSLVTAMAQQVVQKTSDTVGATIVQHMRATGQAAAAAAAASAAGQTSTGQGRASAGPSGASAGQTGSGQGSAGAGQTGSGQAAPAGPEATDALDAAIAHPVQTVVTAVHQVDRYGKSIGLVFFMLFMAIGGVILTVAGYVATAKLTGSRYPAALWFGRWLGLLLPATALGAVATAFIQLFGFSMVSPGVAYGIAILGAIAFMSFTPRGGAVFGRAGLPLAAILIPLQVAAGGAMMGPELTPGFYQAVSKVIPYTYMIDGVRHGMFGGSAGTAAVALVVIAGSCLALALALCFVPELFRRRKSAAEVMPAADSA